MGRALVDAVEEAGLRGRGGAAFSTGRKLRGVAARPGPRYVLANGEEGEPASIKDRWLLRHRPHLVLDGLVRAAEAVDADVSFVYVADGRSAESVQAALAELGHGPLPIELVMVERTYVAGEETAAVRFINGGPAKPTDKPPRPFEAGVRGQPTVVANVETLANLPFIATEGPADFRSCGTPESPGTFLMTVSGACRRPGLYELPLGITLGDALQAAGGTVVEPAGYLLGGFFGGIVGRRALSLPLAYDELRREGTSLGCGAIVVLPSGECPVAAARDLLSFFEHESSQQCGVCINGTRALRTALETVAIGEATETTRGNLERWSRTLDGRGACGLLSGAALLARALQREFPEELERHQQHGCRVCETRRGARDASSALRVEF